ncbi:MAG: DUF1385 domain-containing protein [Armatimonadota bacterium]|nr:DUF1385 domain-containing protein [Armatimonadota bacterium]
MRDAPILSIIRRIKPLSPGDTIGRAAELLRTSGLSMLPVVSNGLIVGVLSISKLLEVLSEGNAKETAEHPVSRIMSQKVICANRYMSIGQASEVMREHGVDALPILDEHGIYLGVITASDVASALSLSIRPPTVAGMATPLGVYLTTGHVRAGAGDIGLFLSGVSLMLLNYLAIGIVSVLAWLLEKTSGLPFWSVLVSPVPQTTPLMAMLKSIVIGSFAPVFLILLRLAPLSGYHAAEHQVVHAIENGEALTPEHVQAQPRVHPRCGTNIVAAATLFLILGKLFSIEVATIIAVLILVTSWKVIGSYFQYYVTTKPPTEKQLASGIRAGKELLERYRSNPGYYVTGWRRIWNTGMPQVMLGVAAVTTLDPLLHEILPGVF